MFGITNLEPMFNLWWRQWLICTSRIWKLPQIEILSIDAGPFRKISFFIRCFSHIFVTVNQLPGLFISRLAIVEDFLIWIYFSNVNIYMSINSYLFKQNLCSMLLKTSFLLSHLFGNVEFELIQLISQHWTVVKDFNS